MAALYFNTCYLTAALNTQIMEIKIRIKSQDIPIDIFNDFDSSFENTEINIDKSYSIDKFRNSSGSISGDVIIDIGLHLTSIIIEVIIYDTIKASIIYSWQKYIAYLKAKQTTINSDRDYISLNLSISPDSLIEYNLKGNIDSESVVKLTEGILSYLKSKDTQKEFSNPDLVTLQNDKPKIRFKLNEATKEWESVNFGDDKRYWEEQKRKASERFNQ